MTSRPAMAARSRWATAVVVAVATSLAVACGSEAPRRMPSPASSAMESESSSSEPTAPPGELDTIAFESEVWGVESGGATVWVESGDGRLLGVDVTTTEVTTELHGFLPTIVGEDLWYASDTEFVRADPVSGDELERFSVPVVGPFAVGGGSVWIASQEQGELVRVDLETKEPAGRVALPEGEPKAVVYEADGAWVAIDGSDVLVKVDASNAIVATVETGQRPHSLALGFGSIWVTNHGETTVTRVDPDGATVSATISDVGRNVAVGIGREFVYAATPSGLAQVDPATNEITQVVEIGPGGDYYDLAVAGGSVWLTSVAEHRVYRVPFPDA